MGLTGRLKWGKEFGPAGQPCRKGLFGRPDRCGPLPRHGLDGQVAAANEGGLPYNADFSKINPAWYDYADRKLAAIVEAGISPCIVACWGYFFPWLGLEKANRHWRHLIARYGAYPVLWCLAGEGMMPYYRCEADPRTSKYTRDELAAIQKKGWTDVGRYVRATDPFHNLVSIHPGDSGRNCVEDDSVLDFDMLQTGHGSYECATNTIKVVRASYARQPAKPVVESEVCYEGILGRARDDLQRLLFLGLRAQRLRRLHVRRQRIWQLNWSEKPYGNSPHGASWGYTPWQKAALLPGAAVVALGKRILEKIDWWKLQPHQEWFNRQATTAGWYEWAQEWDYPQIAGVQGELLVAYTRHSKAPWDKPEHYRFEGLTPGGPTAPNTWTPTRARSGSCPSSKPTPAAAGDPLAPYIGDVMLIVEKTK